MAHFRRKEWSKCSPVLCAEPVVHASPSLLPCLRCFRASSCTFSSSPSAVRCHAVSCIADSSMNDAWLRLRPYCEERKLRIDSDFGFPPHLQIITISLISQHLYAAALRRVIQSNLQRHHLHQTGKRRDGCVSYHQSGTFRVCSLLLVR